jgi:hypothetical protein
MLLIVHESIVRIARGVIIASVSIVTDGIPSKL